MGLAFEPGTAPSGEAYDAIMTNLNMNHLAIVQRGRAGKQARIGDNWGASPMTNDGKPKMTLRTIVVDGLTVETADAGAAVIEKLQADKTTLQTEASNAKTAHDTAMTEKQATHDTAMAAKDTEFATTDPEIKKLKDAQLSDADFDKRVA